MAAHEYKTRIDFRSTRIPGDVVALGLWLRAVFVGASGIAIGLAGLLSHETQLSPFTLCAVALGGGVLAALSWQRCQTLLARIDQRTEFDPEPSAPAALLSHRFARANAAPLVTTA